MNRWLPYILLCLLVVGCSRPLPRVIVLNDPLDARQHNDLGVAYETTGDYDLALREYARAAKLEKTWDRPLINQGNVLAAQQQWDQAVKSYRAALRRDPGNGEAMNNLAWVLLQKGDLDHAKSWAEQALSSSPDNADFQDTLTAIQTQQAQTAQ
jgi:tetratricopeptide (TPR) repeat protein